MKKKIIYTAIASIAVSCNTPDKQETQETKQELKPNIIYIMVDDLGYGDLGCYGQETIRTPEIDQMAKEGMKFTEHYAGSTVSAPSRCALMTGKHMGHAYVRDNGAGAIPAEEVTVAELLKKAGYVTGQMGKWGIGQKNTSGDPMKQGFDYFVGYLNQIHAHNSYPAWMWKNDDTLHLDNEVEIIPETYAKGIGGIATERNTHSHDVFTKEAFQFIEENKDTSFFLYLAYTLPHANNEAWYWDSIGMEVPELMGYDTIQNWPRGQQAFAASITYIDRDVGRLLDKLKALNIEQNTLVIFTSDNGPHKEGGNDPEICKSAGPLRGIKRDLYDGGIRVPLIARWPGKIEPNSTSEHVSAFWDFLPTACEVAGIDVPENSDGISYLPELLGKQQKKHDYLYWEINIRGGRQALRKGRWKAVRYQMSENNDKPVELYDLSVDIGETNNVADNYPDVAKQMLQLMKQAHETPRVKSSRFEFEKKQ